MTSERKTRANRANARASTGPRTTQGRARAGRNALRHGLSLSIHSDRALSEEVEALAQEIAGTDITAERKEFARRIAEAQIDLRHVRHVRHQLFSEALSDPEYEPAVMQRKELAAILRFVRVSGADAPLPDELLELLNSKPKGSLKLALSCLIRLVSC